MSNLKILSTKNLPEDSEEFLPFFLGNSEDEAEKNYKRFAKMLNNISAAYSKATGIEKEDLFGAGLTGLARALRDFDPDRADNFSVYANYRIRSVLNEYCRKNKCVVPIPHYVAFAHGYITKVRNILLKYPEVKYELRDVLLNEKLLKDTSLSFKDKSLCKTAIAHLKTLSENSEVPYINLIERSEYIPLNISFEESYLTNDDFEERDIKQIHITAFISTLREKMTPKELEIADGIMMGKTYDEIGAEQNPPRSASWVRKQLNKIRERITEE